MSDRCKGCPLKGNLAACRGDNCFGLESWIVAALEAEFAEKNNSMASDYIGCQKLIIRAWKGRTKRAEDDNKIWKNRYENAVNRVDELQEKSDKSEDELNKLRERIKYFEGNNLPEGLTAKALREWLELRGYDGLCGCECGCEITNLCACGEGYGLICKPGYKFIEGSDWKIQETKTAKVA